jgi:uncharacterized membrane protein YhhN
VCIAGLGVTLAGEVRGSLAARAVGKCAASLGFLVHAAERGLVELAPHGPWMVAALVLSAVGDVALLGESRRAVLGGIAAFLLAHVAYGAAFVSLGVAPGWSVAAALPLAVGGGLVLRALWMRAGPLAPAVAAYVAVIGVMVALAAGVAAHRGPGWLVAAVLFFVSDLFVARQRFVVRTSVNRLVGLPLYYAAQLAFVAVA